MNSQLFTYSLIRTLYDQGKDYIDSFWPLVVKVLPIDGIGIPLETIQSKIKERYSILIPQHSLRTIITRAARKKLVVRHEKNVSLTKQGIEFFNKLETERQAERRVNELLEDARDYMERRHKQSLSIDQIKERVQAFVLENLEIFEQFSNLNNVITAPSKEISNQHVKPLIDYFIEVELSKPTIFKTLQDIVYGSIISITVHSSEMFGGTKKRFEQTLVYLDSNYIFSLLNLGYEEDNKPAHELFKLMKAEGTFEFRVFDFTIEEIINLLKNYGKNNYHQENYTNSKQNSIFSSLRTKGWTMATVKEFVINIENRLWDELAIKIASSNVNLKKYLPEDFDRRSELKSYKPDQGFKQQNHDLAAIDQIRSLRQRTVKRIEKCNAMFLTSDLKLALYNYKEEGHEDKSTIGEVIPDRLLTNILWLKNPGANGKFTLDVIIAMHSRQLFMDQHMWKQLYKTVSDLKNRKNIDEKHVSDFLFGNHIQEVLKEYQGNENEEQNNPSFLTETLEAIPSDYQVKLFNSEDEKSDKAIAPPEVNIIDTPTTEVYEKTAELEAKLYQVNKKHEKVLSFIENLKKLQEQKAKSETNFWFNATIIIAIMLLFGISFLIIQPILQRWGIIEPIAWLLKIVISLGLPLCGIRFNPLKWRTRLKDNIFNHVYRKKLQGLENLKINLTS